MIKFNLLKSTNITTTNHFLKIYQSSRNLIPLNKSIFYDNNNNISGTSRSLISIKSRSSTTNGDFYSIKKNWVLNSVSSGNDSTLGTHRYYSTHNQHHHKKDEEFGYDKEEFKKPPKFFKSVVAIVSSVVLYHFVTCLFYFDSDQILADIKTILTIDDPLIKNNLLKAINNRAHYPFTIEKLYKLGVVEVLVKTLDDPDPTIQSTTIMTLSSFVKSRYETFSVEAVKKGVGVKLGQIILQGGMNSDAAINLWCELFFSDSNQMQLLQSNELLSTLKSFAYSDQNHLQELAISTIKLLYTNREAYPLLPKTKGILHHLKKSSNVLVSNNSEYYLGVLKGEFIPPVGNVTMHIVDSPLIYRVHTCLNFLMVPLAYMYCSYRWKKYTNDPIYWKAKGAYGAATVLLAGILASLSLYPDYYSYKIDKRLKKEFNSEILTNPTPTTPNNTILNSNNNNSNNSLVLNEKSKTTTTDQKVPPVKKSNWVFSPISLFLIHQLFPIFGNALLLNGWRNSRYIALPSLFLVIPISTLHYPFYISSNWNQDILHQ
ncbi:hypothetical protein DLAC_08294 [Tieghemostelium lacteum]|uniref:Armadillo repeat-containing domain-containing protein n=1 Tax=Tieghemostelium lacteum TaxID=361077 RepID=A0A151ZBP1_TIELA|nr:hypothetical protein DLAC_08294 [Tieghemostelium lacteum]|eukprot:KYQ91345.1 hypothetical protein DLAC_08294 [Tieghemostelium lacteum]